MRVRRTPGSGCMAKWCSTPTWLWPPPTSTMSRTMGEAGVCIGVDCAGLGGWFQRRAAPSGNAPPRGAATRAAAERGGTISAAFPVVELAHPFQQLVRLVRTLPFTGRVFVGFGQRGVGVDGAQNFVEAQPVFHGQHVLGQQVAGMGA